MTRTNSPQCALARAEIPYSALELFPLALLPEDFLRAALAASEDDRLWLLLERATPVTSLPILDNLPRSALAEVLQRWQDDSELLIGELLMLAKILGDKKHRQALEADLIGKGMRLRHCPTPDFNWHDLIVIVLHLPVTSNLFSAMFPDRAGWTREALLLAEAVDSLHWLQWAKTKDGSKNRNRPKPIPRPGVTDAQPKGAKPKAAPLSRIKERFEDRYAKAHRPALSPKDRSQKLNDLFGRR